MTNKQFSLAFTEASNYTDIDAFISDLSLSSIWEDAPEDDIPADRVEQLREIFMAAHRSVREIRASTGLSQVQFAARFAIPRRTFEDWESLGTCPSYVRLMMQEALGLTSIARN